MPVDTWMPRWDARSNHQIEVAASPDRVYHTLLTTEFDRNPLIRVLMTLRAVPALLLSPRATWTRWRSIAAARETRSTRNLRSGAFIKLEATPPTDLILGLTGRFWSPSGGLVASDTATFREPVPHGLARATWSFHIDPISPGRSCLQTETRVLCADSATRTSFLRYWRVIRPGSGIIRWALLRQVKHAAEAAVV